MSARRAIAKSIANVYACGRCLSPPRSGLRVLMYHAVGSPALGDSLGLFSVTPAEFSGHMEYLATRCGHDVVALNPGLGVGSGCQVAITFDDGYQDNLDVAAPILVEKGLPFTVFVTTNFVRDGRSGFLSKEALRELARQPGVTIGAHGTSHVALTGCDDKTLREELVGSRSYLEDTLGVEVVTMAYPYGAADRRVRDAAENAGYRLAACSFSNINDNSRDRMLLARTEVLAGDSGRVFRQKIRGDWDWYRWRTQDPARS